MVRSSTRRDTGRRVGLDPRLIGNAALALIDAEGSEALTMRRLARRLDVTPMALYNHVAGRAEVDRLIVDAIFEEAAKPDGLVADLAVIADRLRDVYLAHPNTISLIQATPPTEIAGLDLIETALRLLSSAGHGIERSRQIWVGLVSLVNGHVAYESQGHFSDPDAAGELSDRLPLLRQAVTIGPLDYGESFRMAVDDYLGGTGTH